MKATPASVVASLYKGPAFVADVMRLRADATVPATTLASERLFSKAGDVLTKKRNRLAPGKADRLLFLMDNL